MTREPANDNAAPDAMLDELLTPDEIARRITASSGVHMTGRTVWEKARRIGVSLKIGRSMLIRSKDIPALLQEENRKWPKSTNEGRSTTSASVGPMDSTEKVLAFIQKKKRKLSRTSG